jgi:hypothetical protein
LINHDSVETSMYEACLVLGRLGAVGNVQYPIMLWFSFNVTNTTARH